MFDRVEENPTSDHFVKPLKNSQEITPGLILKLSAFSDISLAGNRSWDHPEVSQRPIAMCALHTLKP